MPTTYNGQGTLPSATVPQSTRQAIVSSTNAMPIVVQITSHGYNTGDTIYIEGHQTNTNANGLWQITKTDANHFSLNGSTGNGVGGATGYAIDYEVQPAFTIPANGDLADMGVLGATLEGLANTVPWLYQRCGAYRIYDIYTKHVSHVFTSNWSQTAMLSSPLQLQNATTSVPLFGFAAPAPVVQTNDILVAQVNITVRAFDTGTSDFAEVGAFFTFAGNPPNGNISYQAIISSAAGSTAPFTLVNAYQVSNIFAGETFDVGLIGSVPSATDVTIGLVGDMNVVVWHYKPN